MSGNLLVEYLNKPICTHTAIVPELMQQIQCCKISCQDFLVWWFLFLIGKYLSMCYTVMKLLKVTVAHFSILIQFCLRGKIE